MPLDGPGGGVTHRPRRRRSRALALGRPSAQTAPCLWLYTDRPWRRHPHYLELFLQKYQKYS